jgi:hypothetical protein
VSSVGWSWGFLAPSGARWVCTDMFCAIETSQRPCSFSLFSFCGEVPWPHHVFLFEHKCGCLCHYADMLHTPWPGATPDSAALVSAVF